MSSLESSASKPLTEFMAGYARHNRAKPKPSFVKRPAMPVRPAFECVITLEAVEPLPIEPIVASNPLDLRRLVCAAFRYELNEFVSHRKQRRLARARHCFCWLCKNHTILSFPEIGRLIGNRHHTSVMHGQKVFEKVKHRYARELNYIAERLEK